jgi:diketogulonate reductase-like aldo/keto reductase
MQEQAMESHGFGLQRIELDLGELAFRDFEPAVDTGLALLDFAAVQAAEKILGVIARRNFAQHGPREGFDGVAAE